MCIRSRCICLTAAGLAVIADVLVTSLSVIGLIAIILTFISTIIRMAFFILVAGCIGTVAWLSFSGISMVSIRWLFFCIGIRFTI